ncbi:hypothetical protein [Pseudoalteromonas sp. R3]|uniref:hypothetical protein n=1 Tax=Pseudoalteromonas sp. R3 TaxID=1709477 RepID=UPI0006B552FF|nr:hypothetical protein [Pseudoalteromonas sp. R3]AZZ98753.1 hypothetical protein ELR70_17605 [Pseudoalteromonas sp. R3]
MSSDALTVLNSTVDFFQRFAPTERGFYRANSVGKEESKKITIQVLEMGVGKPQHIEALAVLSHKANSEFFDVADELLITLANEIKLAIEAESKSINSALNGSVIGFTLTEAIKIIPPEPQDKDAKAVFSLNIKYK